jgi:serine/threonine protein kinase
VFVGAGPITRSFCTSACNGACWTSASLPMPVRAALPGACPDLLLLFCRFMTHAHAAMLRGIARRHMAVFGAACVQAMPCGCGACLDALTRPTRRHGAPCAQATFLVQQFIYSLYSAGEIRWPRCSLAYAPPEVVLAVNASEDVAVHPSHDVYALGVMASEAIARQAAHVATSDIFACAASGRRYLWEEAAAEQPAPWRQSRLRALVEPCLARDAAARLTAAALAEIGRLGQATTAPSRVASGELR